MTARRCWPRCSSANAKASWTGLNAVVAVDERVFVEITGPRLTERGLPGGRACMVVTIHDGRIVRMQDYPSRAAALAGAGLPPEPAADDAEDDLTADPPLLRAGGPLARKVTDVIHSGDAAALTALLGEHPALAGARIGDPERGQSRTLLHVLHRLARTLPRRARQGRLRWSPPGPTSTRASPAASETPLHWAASSDDVEALDALLDAGADIEAGGAVIAGGTPIADAVAFGQWNAAGDYSDAAHEPTSGRRPRSGSSNASRPRSPRPHPPRRTSTTHCGAPLTVVNARPPSCY